LKIRRWDGWSGIGRGKAVVLEKIDGNAGSCGRKVVMLRRIQGDNIRLRKERWKA
jgi:hypothetical protein